VGDITLTPQAFSDGWETTQLIQRALAAKPIFMPSGLKRFHHSGQSYFVTFTCYHRLPHLADEKTCQAFVFALERARKLYQFRVYGFIVMPEHAHLLISEPESGTIAKAVQALKISSSLRTTAAREC
jgi:putative transposase